MHMVLNGLGAGFAVTAAVLWLIASGVNVKSETGTGGYQTAADMLDTAKRQMVWNRWAAFAMAVAAVSLAIGSMMSCCPD